MIYNIAHTVERSAQLFPDKEAFRFGNTSITFDTLNRKSDCLANYLCDCGVKKGDRIGIYMHRCLETAIALYGILKSGAAYVPLDPSAPPARTRYLIEDCAIRILMVTQKQQARVNKLYTDTLPLERVIGVSEHPQLQVKTWDAIFSISLNGYQKVDVLGQDLAYIMYTSGSTGTPKGIMHTHNSGLAYAKLATDLYGLSCEDRLANHAPLHFDVSTFAYFGGPMAGATSIIISDAHTKMPASLAHLIAEEKITVWYSVPLALSQMVQGNILTKYDYSALRWVLFAGETFPIKNLKRLMQLWPQAHYSNIYGPAETNQCTNYNFDIRTPIGDFLPIGKTWGDTEYCILTSQDHKVPKGESGELVVRSATMMLGYWNNNELTEKAFYHEKVAGNFKHTFYRTGDMVREDENGNLIFIGRTDRQIKIRGYRIEMDEIEAILLRHEGVREAVVCVLENSGSEKQLLAAVVLNPNVPIDSNGLLGYCRTELPMYAIPGAISILTDFPRTGSGKIDLRGIQEHLIGLQL